MPSFQLSLFSSLPSTERHREENRPRKQWNRQGKTQIYTYTEQSAIVSWSISQSELYLPPCLCVYSDCLLVLHYARRFAVLSVPSLSLSLLSRLPAFPFIPATILVCHLALLPSIHPYKRTKKILRNYTTEEKTPNQADKSSFSSSFSSSSFLCHANFTRYRSQ